MEFNLMNLISENLIILVPALYIIGIFLKKSRVRDELIPWILLFIGIAFSTLTSGLRVQSVVQGILIAGVTVLGNQLYVQTFKK